ncbi:CU044_5270 family protein [Microtetraspora niveoalba]|uniref:CU044_5270 family protein n=1 Tax=Microtetraspora niveoalba TaxID=46175 RepID=UPI00082B0FC2|nr:CU044_5270 family protein [Microtetraspora niveoalba]
MNEIQLLNMLRDEVPAQPDLRAEEHRLLAEIRAVSSTPRRSVRPAPRPRWGLALAGAVALAAAVTVTRLGGADGPGGGPPAVRPPTAAAVLEKAALVAAKGAAVEIRPDQWFYMKESQHLGNLPAFEHWVRMDGRGDAVRTDGGTLKIGDGEKGPTNPARTQREVESLPTDPDALLEHFRDLPQGRTSLSICAPACPAESEKDIKAFETIGWYLKFGPMISPEKTAAMYRALARIPQVTIEENATDGDGRKGVGVVLDLGAAGKGYYILDPGDYHYLGVKVVNDDQTFAMSVLASGVVDKPGQVP